MGPDHCRARQLCARFLKSAFNARHGGVGGLARMAHDLLLRTYLQSEESKELADSFANRRSPDSSRFGH